MQKGNNEERKRTKIKIQKTLTNKQNKHKTFLLFKHICLRVCVCENYPLISVACVNGHPLLQLSLLFFFSLLHSHTNTHTFITSIKK